MKVIGARPSMVGDCLMAIPIMAYIRKHRPDAYVNWVVASKCSVAVPLYIGHPLIDRLHVSSTEGYGPELNAIVKSCDLVFDPLPQHPTGDSWVNDPGMDIYSETFRMAGLPLTEYATLTADEKRPRLYPWWPIERRAKTVALWPAAHHGVKQKRHPSFEWYLRLIDRLDREGYAVTQFGHPNDFKGRSLTPAGNTVDARERPFLDQVQTSIGHDVVITTDSGAGLVQGAYGVPQVSLLTNHWPGHDASINPHCFATNNPRNKNLFVAGDPDLIEVDSVVAAIKEVTQ